MRLPALILAAAAASAQPAPAPKLTGFPFQDETLRYALRWPSGLALGEAAFTARRATAGWSFRIALDAGVPGFAIKDSYTAAATAELCSSEFERNFNHRGKHTAEKTTFDLSKRRAVRATTVPPSDGKTEFDIPACPHDAVSFIYFMRKEMGQGRVPPAETVYFGAGYSVQLRYTGEVKTKDAVADRLAGSVKGPSSSFTLEIDFARDPARTPLVIRVPLAVGAVTAELVR
jgi:hypothetical protein